jgi:hypothetical protein
MDFRDDVSRLDAFMASRRRATVLHALWRPMLAGAVASLAVSAAIWAVLPRFEVREVVVDHVVPHDVTVDHVVPKDVEVDRIVPHDVEVDRLIPRGPAVSSPQPQSPEAFIDSPPFRSATIKGRFAGPDMNGFKLDSGQTVYPARLINGKVDLATDLLDDVSKLSIGDPIYCAPIAPEGLFRCQAFHRGKVEQVVAIPVGRPT